ncbi:MAG: ResB family protein [Nocardioides sp.]|nr:ResB family protein [Nocardioides sp.]
MSAPPEGHERRPGELNLRELGRWLWRQLTSMRTALILLLLLALAAVPGSIIPQKGVDALKTSNWQDQHPKLTPIYERLGLFAVYDSPWFSAIYLLLVISLVGCIVPRTWVYARAIRADPPAAPRNLSRLPDHASYDTDEPVDEVLARARVVLRAKGYRVRAPSGAEDDAVSAERGYLREVGNLVFHLSVLVVLVGFAMGGLFGYKGGVILVVGDTFANTLTQYDDFVPGKLFDAADLDPFSFVVDHFQVDWLKSGPRQGMARGFDAQLRYKESPGAAEKSYDLRVNHPLTVGNTEVFLIGHGYAPVVTIRDGEGNIAFRGPTVFLPQDQSFLSFGVIKAPFAKPAQIGLEGLFYPTFINLNGDPVNVMGDLKNPKLSMLVYTGDLGLNDGSPQSVYVLNKAGTQQVKNDKGKPLRLDLSIGDKIKLPNGMGTVSFDDVVRWNRIQISQTPGKRIALGGVVLALIGLLGSLFIRPRRTWVRVRREGGVTLVEVAALDRSGGGDVSVVISNIVSALRGDPQKPGPEEKS